jgi:hypothetical protein
VAEGIPPYNDENLIMLSAAALLASPALAEQLAAARTAAFHRAMTIDRPSAVAAAAKLAETVSALKERVRGPQFSGADAFALVDAISTPAINDRLTDYAGSQQAVMGVDTLLNSMVSSGRVTVGAAAGHSRRHRPRLCRGQGPQRLQAHRFPGRAGQRGALDPGAAVRSCKAKPIFSARRPLPRSVRCSSRPVAEAGADTDPGAHADPTPTPTPRPSIRRPPRKR